ncbi:hypothetical protein [Salinisphaera sp. Q1T1-3]|uniref:hypothetical protein n=1 Tax=Salinisphaera sp. Q1T1-3 TaxID=2321229 RepID=UPI000E732CEE|nr:hypothetical protein [Salinisphaera sp. Q1T1-3]RJS92103.1 hypothetical protein D3260_13275 [Salinisphaera sp. Q1T1-3]
MIAGFFSSGAVAVVGLVVLAGEALWFRSRGAAVPWAHLLAGAGLLAALLGALRGWPWPFLALTLGIALAGHVMDRRRR